MNIKKCLKRRCRLLKMNKETKEMFCPRFVGDDIVPVKVAEVTELECLDKRGIINNIKKHEDGRGNTRRRGWRH